MQRRMLSAIAATGLGLVLAASTTSPSLAVTGGAGVTRATASEQCRTIDFDKADVTPIASTDPARPGIRHRLTVSGTKSGSNVRVRLVPLTYIRQPAYWGITVTGCASGPGLTVLLPYTVTYDFDATMGSCGVEVLGATRSQQIDLAGCRPTTLAGTTWLLDPTSLGVPVPTGASITANFSATGLSGSSGCNTYMTTYSTDATGAFKIGTIAMTARACDAVTMKAESTYLSRLTTSTQVQSTKTQLLLRNGGQTLLAFTPAAAATTA